MDGLPLNIRIRNYAANLLSFFILRRNGTVNRRLLRFFEFVFSLLPAAHHAVDAVATSDHSVDPARDLWFRSYSPPPTTKPLPVIVYFHGGGFALFSPKTTEINELCRRLAVNIPAVVLSVNYRLSPENRYPCQYDDGFDALQHIDANQAIIGDLDRCFLAGDSAGANIAHHIAIRVSGFEFERIRIRGLVSIQPFFGGEGRTGSEIRMGEDWSLGLTLRSTDIFWKAFLPVGSGRNHPAAHAFGPGSVDLAGVEYPPTVVFIGGRDVLQDWQRKYRDWLVGSGKEVRVVVYPNAWHGFCFVAGLPESGMVVDEVRHFVCTTN